MNKSENIGALALALSKLQGEIQNLYKDKQGYGYKYAELSSVLDVTRPLCAKYELSVTQLCGTDTTGVTVETVLLHSSGEWLSSTLSLPLCATKGMASAQAIGSCISYGRRYSLAALVGIAQTDNDAAAKDELAAQPKLPLEDNITASLRSKLNSNDLPVKRLRALMLEHKLEDKELAWLSHFNVDSLDRIETDDVLRLIKTIEGKV